MSQQEARPIRVEPGHKRIRALLAGEYVADSTRVRLVWTVLPDLLLPPLAMSAPTFSSLRTRTSTRGAKAPRASTASKSGVMPRRRRSIGTAESPISGIIDHVRFDWDAMDAWFEEDDQVHVHPRDPYTRVDVLQSSRHLRVELDGVTVADSRSPRILFETGLVPRF